MNTMSPQYPYQSQSPYGNSQMYNTGLNPMDKYSNNQYSQPMFSANTPLSYNMIPNMPMQQNNYIKCRPVASIDEARASQVDLDGSLNVFTDIGNKKIYTKQINLDGTASLNTYCLVDEIEPPVIEYVTKQEFDAVVKELQTLLAMQQQAAQHPTIPEKISF